MTPPQGTMRTGLAPFIAARENEPSRVTRPDAVPMARVLQVSTWDAAPIPTAQNFFRTELANLVLAGAVNSTVVTTIAGGGALQLPANSIASIQAVQLYCNAPTLTTNITYTVRANGVPQPGLTNLKFPPLAAGSLLFPIPGPFNVLLAGSYIDVLITRVVADVAAQVNFTMLGWFCSPQDVLRWTGVQPGQNG
jgi:hypothetical protein